MPRLVGKRSNNKANIIVLIMLVAIVGVMLEYLGVINIVPGFGREGRNFQLQGQLNKEQIVEQSNQ